MEPFSKTVFIEYSSAREGQHLITVVQKVDHERVIIGRIYRDFDPQTKKPSYRAYDFKGNQIFFDTNNLYELKNRFKEHGKSLADTAISVNRISRNPNQRISTPPSQSRLNDMRTLRDEKGKSINKQTSKAPDKRELAQMEKEQDDRNQTHYHDLGSVVDHEDSQELSHEMDTGHEEIDTDREPDLDEESYGDDIADRESELAEIRDSDDDREQDHDIDR